MTEERQVICQVKICLYKPEGFEDTWYVDTKDRGAAVLRVFSEYVGGELVYLNHAIVRFAGVQECPPDQREFILSL